jgi:hypothetical protein
LVGGTVITFDLNQSSLLPGPGHPGLSNRAAVVAYLYVLPSGLAEIVGKPALFSLANSWAKFYQVDTHRKPVAMKDEF